MSKHGGHSSTGVQFPLPGCLGVLLVLFLLLHTCITGH